MASAELASERGRQKLSHGGYAYVFAQFSKDKRTEFWRCQHKNHKTMRCLARLHREISSGEISLKGRHTDPADAAAIEVQARKSAMKRRAEDTVETPLQIITNARRNSSLAAQGAMGTNKALARIVQRARKRLGIPPTHFPNLASINIPEEYRRFEATPGNFENFLLGDSGADDRDRILMFGRASTASWIGHVSKLYVDGTFSVAPHLFEQLFVILGERPGTCVPLCYVLLPNKTEASYSKMLDMLTLGWPDLNPVAISMDFEKASMNAFSAYFPDADLHGCFFHLVQNVKKHVASCRLTARYRAEPDFALKARMISAMAFLPPERLEGAVRDLRQYLPVELHPVLNYFEDNYMGRLQIEADGTPTRREALFPASMWTVYARTLRGDSRTNNYAEAFHRTLKRHFGEDHPQLLKFIEKLRTAQHDKDAQLERYVGNQPAPGKRNKYVLNDQRILEIVQDVNNRINTEYLRGIARCYIMDP